MILGSDELTDADIRIFFKNKQEESGFFSRLYAAPSRVLL